MHQQHSSYISWVQIRGLLNIRINQSGWQSKFRCDQHFQLQKLTEQNYQVARKKDVPQANLISWDKQQQLWSQGLKMTSFTNSSFKWLWRQSSRSSSKLCWNENISIQTVITQNYLMFKDTKVCFDLQYHIRN